MTYSLLGRAGLWSTKLNVTLKNTSRSKTLVQSNYARYQHQSQLCWWPANNGSVQDDHQDCNMNSNFITICCCSEMWKLLPWFLVWSYNQCWTYKKTKLVIHCTWIPASSPTRVLLFAFCMSWSAPDPTSLVLLLSSHALWPCHYLDWLACLHV